MALTVQFFGMDDVMQASENINCPAWAIFISRQLFTKFEGTDLSESMEFLHKNLEALARGGSVAIYTLKFFEASKEKPIKINERTVCDGGSFNFKLIEPEEREAKLIGSSAQYGIIAQMQKDMQELKQFIRDREEEEVEEPETVGSVLIDAIKNPDQLMNLVNAGRMLFGMPPQSQPVTIGSINNAAGLPLDKEAQLQRLSVAIDCLEKADPKIVDHLEKLAKIATENPMQFKMLLTMLDAK